MAEPYVPIAEYTASNAVLVSLEAVTNVAKPNTDALAAATTSALTSKNTCNTLAAEKFETMFLVGA